MHTVICTYYYHPYKVTVLVVRQLAQGLVVECGHAWYMGVHMHITVHDVCMALLVCVHVLCQPLHSLSHATLARFLLEKKFYGGLFLTYYNPAIFRPGNFPGPITIASH